MAVSSVFKPCWVLLAFMNFPMFSKVIGSLNDGGWIGFTFFTFFAY